MSSHLEKLSVDRFKIGGYELVVVSESTVRIDYPTGYSNYSIQYDDGNIAYDHPESVPKYVKRAVEKVYNNETK